MDERWPEPHLGDIEREKDHVEIFKVILTNNKGETWTRDLDSEGEFNRFVPKSRWSLKVDRFGVVHDITPR